MGWALPKTRKFADPRLAIAKHIGWQRSNTGETEFHTPEPDNFNYAMHSTRPLLCPVIADTVAYKSEELGGWWSVYCVPDRQLLDFYAWAEQQDVDLYWSNPRASRKRSTRPLLWTRKAQPELTDQERLYTMGYYDNLQTKFNIDISHKLGQPRENMPGIDAA